MELERLATCDAPLLPSVPVAVVLTMARGNPRAPAPTSPLTRLCETTYVQYNPGYAKCAKPAWVTHSGFDVTHAYMHACKALRRVCGNRPLLILEDDAVFVPGRAQRRTDFQRVDAFLARHHFDIYSLASLGFTHACSERHHRRFAPRTPFAYTQAVVWSHRTRSMLLRQCGHTIPHVDAFFLGQKIRHRYTYVRPLVVQTLPSTANSQKWCMWCTPATARLDEFLVRRVWHKFVIQNVLRLDRHVTGWTYLYALTSAELLACLVAAVAATAALVRSTTGATKTDG